MSSTPIPSVAAMNEMFNNRMRWYASEFASREASSSEKTTEALKEPIIKAPKRKRDDETSETEDATEESGEEEEEEEAPGPQGNRKIILKINFTQNIILSVNPAPSHQPTHPPAEPEAGTSHVLSAPRRRRRRHRSPTPHTSTIHQRLRPRRSGDEAQNTSSQRPLPSRQPTSTTAPATASSSPSSPPPPLFPSFRIQNEKKERWDPIPLPCPLLPDDEEGPKAAWARLFPDEKPFGEYGGKPTSWMEKMCWKEGEWRARGPEEPYVERFLGRKREAEMEGSSVLVAVGWRRG